MEVTASCCACLVTEEKLYSVEENNLQQALEDLTDLPVKISSLPLYLCYLCRALVMKFAAFRAAYRYTHLILLKEIRKGKVIDGEITQHEHNVRKNAGLLLTISETGNIDIKIEVNSEICFAGTNSEENDNENFNELEIKGEIKPESNFLDKIDDNIENYRDLVLIVQNEHDYTMSDCASDTKREAGMENSQEKIENDILEDNDDDDINIEEEFLISDDANSDVWELNPRDELANFYGNKKSKLYYALTAKNEKNKTTKEEKDIIKNNEATGETCTENSEKQNGNKTNNEISTKDKTTKEEKDIIKNNEATGETCTENSEKQNENKTNNEISTKDKTTKEEKAIIKNNEATGETCSENSEKQNGNETNNEISTKDVDQQNKNIKTKKKYQQKPCKTAKEKSNIVFREPDKYSSRTRMKTSEAYEKFGKKYNVKIDFYITKEEQMNAFLARKETDNYKKGIYKCELCYFGFMTRSAHTNHMKDHEKHEKRQFKCEFCHRYFPSNRCRLKHLDGHCVKYTCLQCEEVFTHRPSVVRHFKAHSGVTYECKKCRRSFRVMTTYYEHIRSAHGSLDNVPCSFCSESYNGPVGLRLHMQRRHPEAKHCFCAGCDRQFNNEAALTAHEASCNPHNSPCVRCGASFPSDEQLAEHVAGEHKTAIVCSECNKQFRSVKNLGGHTCRAHEHNPYVMRRRDTAKMKSKMIRKKLCDVCGKILTLAAYQYHMQMHEQKKTFECEVCDKRFRRKNCLKIHQRCHTGLRPFHCSLCNKAFRQDIHLRRHMKTHSDERPVACQLCRSRFKDKCNLREHIRVQHEGLPPFKRNRKRRKEAVKRETQHDSSDEKTFE